MMTMLLRHVRAAMVAAWTAWASALPEAPAERAQPAVEAVLEVVAERGALPTLDEAATIQLLLTWSLRESRWDAAASGGLGLAPGVLSCGSMQVVAPWRWTGTTCAEAAADLRVGYAAGHAVMRHALLLCGSVRAGLGAYATGRCGGASELVAARMALAGLGGGR